jgi:hypothetical protein
MTRKQIQKAIKEGKKMVWNDPDPIKSSDYTITDVFNLDNDEMCLIHYGSGSEAEVYLHEIQLKQ